MKKRYPLLLLLAAALVVGGFGLATARPRSLHWKADSRIVFHAPEFDLVHTGELERASISTLSRENLFAGEGRFIYRDEGSAEVSGPERSLFNAPSGSLGKRLREAFASSPLVRHFRKVPPPFDAVILRSGSILVLYDRMYRSTDGGQSFAVVDSLPASAAHPDMYGLSEATPRDDVYYGELTFQPGPHPVRVYKGTNDGQAWSVVYTFPAGVTGHVHNIVYDRFSDRLWLCTGDDAKESKLFYTDDDFRSVHVLGEGDAGWRIVGLIVTKDSLFWGSDGEPAGSNIYRYDFASGKRRVVQAVGNPVWFATQLSDGTMVVASSYEPFIPYSAEQSPPREAALWISRDGNRWRKSVTFSYRPDVHVGLNAVLGLSQANAQRPALYVSPFGPIEKSLTVQRYEVRWRTGETSTPP